MPQALFTFAQKTPNQIRDDILRTVKAGLIADGIPTPNVGPGSDYYLMATAFSIELGVVVANQVIMADQLMPDTAAGPNLDRWLALVGLSRNPAIPSHGLVTPTYSVPSTVIVSGTQLTDSSGLLYQVLVGGTYGQLGSGFPTQVPVIAVVGGKASNHANGDTLRWVTAPPYTGPAVTVGTPSGSDGLSGGADSEIGVDGPPRARLFQLLQNPPKGGNSADIASWASASSPVVQAVGVYPALLGPATAFFTVSAAPQQVGPFTSLSKSRVVPTATVNGTIVPYVQALLPEHALIAGVSTLDQPTNVALQMVLPSAPTASPPGPGGGWVDGSPWPLTNGGVPCIVTGVTNSTVFTVNAQTPPSAGISHIAWLSPLNWTLYTAVVLSFSGSVGAYTITIDTPFVGINLGYYVFPQAVQQQNYVSAIFTAFGNLGAGEWTNYVPVLARSFRHPPPTLVFPSTLDANFLRTMENAGPEVKTAAFLFTSGLTPSLGAYPPVLNAAGQVTSTAPSILTPNNLAWYPS